MLRRAQKIVSTCKGYLLDEVRMRHSGAFHGPGE